MPQEPSPSYKIDLSKDNYIDQTIDAIYVYDANSKRWTLESASRLFGIEEESVYFEPYSQSRVTFSKTGEQGETIWQEQPLKPEKEMTWKDTFNLFYVLIMGG